MKVDVRMVEVIKEGEIVRMSESQALDEDLFILREVIGPENEGVRGSEFSQKILQKTQQKIEGHAPSYSRLERWKAGKVSYKRNNVVDELVENFHWEVARGRRRKDITRRELADAIGVTEEEIKSIEFGELPSDDFVLINKIEDHLGIGLRKEKKIDGPTLSQLQEMKEGKVKEEIDKVRDRRLDGKAENLLGRDIELVE